MFGHRPHLHWVIPLELYSHIQNCFGKAFIIMSNQIFNDIPQTIRARQFQQSKNWKKNCLPNEKWKQNRKGWMTFKLQLNFEFFVSNFLRRLRCLNYSRDFGGHDTCQIIQHKNLAVKLSLDLPRKSCLTCWDFTPHNRWFWELVLNLKKYVFYEQILFMNKLVNAKEFENPIKTEISKPKIHRPSIVL